VWGGGGGDPQLRSQHTGTGEGRGGLCLEKKEPRVVSVHNFRKILSLLGGGVVAGPIKLWSGKGGGATGLAS